MYYILPILILSTFQEIDIHQVRCPIKRENYNLTGNLLAEMKLVELDSDKLRHSDAILSGRECYHEELITSCKPYLFSKNMIKYDRIITSPDRNSCTGPSNYVSQRYPTPVCTWKPFSDEWSISKISNVIIKERLLQYDFNEGKIRNQGKLFDNCDANGCTIKGKKGYWMRDQSVNTTCNNNEDERNNTLQARLYNSTEGFWLDVGGKVILERDICIIRVCGEDLYYISDHSLYTGGNTYYFKRCQKKDITYDPDNEIIQDLSYELECEDTIMRALITGILPYKDMTKLNPTSIGIHHVYRWGKQGKIEVALGYYDKVRRSDRDAINKALSWYNCGGYSKCSYNGRIDKRNKSWTMTEEDFMKHREEVISYFYHNLTTDGFMWLKEDTLYDKNESLVVSLFNQYNHWLGECILIVIVILIFIKCLSRRMTNQGSTTLLLRPSNHDAWS